MEIKKLLTRTKNLILRPSVEWESIKMEGAGVRKVIVSCAIPLITLGSVTLLLRNLFSEYSYYGVLLTAVIYFVSMIGGMYLSALVITEIAESFKIQTTRATIFNLVIYSSIAFYLGRAAANLHEQLALLNIFSFYTIYLYWIGVSIYFRELEKHKTGFVLISVLTIYIFYLLFQYLLAPLSNLTNNLGFIQ